MKFGVNTMVWTTQVNDKFDSTFARIKATLLRNQGLDADRLRARLEAEGAQMKATMRRPDAQEGLTAFMEKRAPRFD